MSMLNEIITRIGRRGCLIEIQKYLNINYRVKYGLSQKGYSFSSKVYKERQ